MQNIVKAENSGQAKIIASLANEIWTHHYLPIIGESQVQYMLEKFQSFEKINFEISSGEAVYYIMYADENPAGYCAIKVEEKRIFLSKLYVHKDFRKTGFGKMMLSYLVENFNNKEYMYLSVNKQNTHSIAAYQKMGFVIADSITKDIGNRFVMDDYVMKLALK